MQDVDRNVNLALLRRLRGMELMRVRVRNAREKSLNERAQAYRASGHGVFFCVHDKHMFTPCAQCRRTQAQAIKNAFKFVSKQSK